MSNDPAHTFVLVCNGILGSDDYSLHGELKEDLTALGLLFGTDFTSPFIPMKRSGRMIGIRPDR